MIRVCFVLWDVVSTRLLVLLHGIGDWTGVRLLARGGARAHAHKLGEWGQLDTPDKAHKTFYLFYRGLHVSLPGQDGLPAFCTNLIDEKTHNT